MGFVFALVRVSDEPPGYGLDVRPGDVPEAAVFEGCVVEREPEADQIERIVVKKSAVLVGGHWKKAAKITSLDYKGKVSLATARPPAAAAAAAGWDREKFMS